MIDTDPYVHIRIMLVDDHPMVRLGLRAMLETEPGFEVIADAPNGTAALVELSARGGSTNLLPDVVVTDLRMPELDGVGMTATISREYPSIRVLVVTTYETDADIIKAVEAGASGYLLKDAPRSDLCAAVRSAARGETVLAPSVAARLMARLRSPSADVLTPREIEVLGSVAQGHTNAEIGRRLFIGESTVKTHLLRVFAKLGVDDRTAAVTIARQRGFLP